MIVDPTRGASLEFLLTLLRVRREHGSEPQTIALSAVIGDTKGLERWFDARLLRREQSPVPLDEGLLRQDGSIRYIASDHDGSEKLEPFIQPQWGRGSSQDWIMPLVKKLVDAGEQVIVFREQKGQTVGCATYLARSLGLPPAQDTIDALPTGDPSVSSADLRRTLAGGVAFHNADLDRDERLAIEEVGYPHRSSWRDGAEENGTPGASISHEPPAISRKSYRPSHFRRAVERSR